MDPMLVQVILVTVAATFTLILGFAYLNMAAKRDKLSAESRALERSATLLVDDGVVADLSLPARALLALAPGDALGPALARIFGKDAAVVERTLAAAVRDGTPARLLIRSADQTPYDCAIEPQGGLMRVSLHDASFVARIFGASVDTDDAEACANTSLCASADAAIAAQDVALWHRDHAGKVIWASGRVGSGPASVDVAACIAAFDLNGPHDPAERLRLSVNAEDGTAVQVIVAERPVANGSAGIVIDASSAAQAEATLGRFVQTMTQTFASLTVGLAIFDRNQRLVLFNPSVVELWGLDPSWLATRPRLRDILDRLRAGRRLPDRRDYHEWRDTLMALFEAPDHADFEEHWSLASGATLRVLARPHAEGALAFIFDDVTETVGLERRFRRMEDLYRATLDRLDEGLMVLGADGTLSYVNQAFHEIWQTDDTSLQLGLHVNDLCALCSQLTVDADIWDRFANFAAGESTRRAWAARVILGSGRVLSARFAPLPDSSTMAIFADTTDSERVALVLAERNEALEAAEQMRGAVLDQISHRLRTPLNTIFGFAQLLADPRFGQLSARQQSYASGVLEAAAQLLDTVSEVTDLASLQIDPLDGEEAPPGAEEVLEITRDLLKSRADRIGVELVLEIDAPIGAITCSPMRMRQIVFNMVADAIHRCPAGGVVRLGASRDPGGAVSITTEESVDLSPGDGTINTVEMNSLTLSLVRRLVAAEGGALSIELNRGASTIRVASRFPEPLFEAAEIASHAAEVAAEERLTERSETR